MRLGWQVAAGLQSQMGEGCSLGGWGQVAANYLWHRVAGTVAGDLGLSGLEDSIAAVAVAKVP